MKKKIFSVAITGALLAMAATSQATLAAEAASGENKLSVSLNDNDFDSQKTGIERQLERGGRYAKLSGRDKYTVRSELRKIEQMLETEKSELNEKTVSDIYVRQERVNAILARATSGSSLVCEDSAELGSRLKSRRCQEKSIADARRQRDREAMESMTRARGSNRQ